MIRPAYALPTARRLAVPMALAASLVMGEAAAQQKPAKPADNKATAAKPAAAQAAGTQAMLLASFGDWGAYASQQGKSKVCYALSQPTEREPKNLNRDPAYLFVSTRPAEGVRNEVSFVMGFATKEGGAAQALVGQSAFSLVTKAENAWVKNPAEEGQVLGAFTRGDKVLVKAESKRGNKLTDEYSLKGFAQALERVKKECP